MNILNQLTRTEKEIFKEVAFTELSKLFSKYKNTGNISFTEFIIDIANGQNYHGYKNLAQIFLA